MNPSPLCGQRRWARPLLLSAGLLAAGLAGAQITLGKLNLAGKEVQSVNLYGAEYASRAALEGLLDIERQGDVMRVIGMGHTMLLPIDTDQVRATTDFNTVQLDTERVKARTATWVNGVVHFPLDTLARGLGAEYRPGNFKLAAPQLQSVSSRAGSASDRLVLDLNRDVTAKVELRGAQVRIILKNTTGKAQRYTTRGAFIPSAEVKQQASDLIVSFTLPQNSGYRVYPVVRSGGTRIVADAGPGIPQDFPAVLERVGKPLIVLDPTRVQDMGRDVTLEVARRSAELLSKAGWQVRMTRDQGTALGQNQKLQLARQSDVYLALDMGRFTQTSRGGVTVYEGSGSSPSKLINAVRGGQAAPYSPLVISDTGGSRRLSELLRGELRSGGVTAEQDTLRRMLTLSEAPQAALLLELGWTGSAQDRANLATEARLQALSVAVARSVANYLTARAANASQASSSASITQTILTGGLTRAGGQP
ncbi:N-acetylmuramoyl-L-alanine amidase family protein [Deinococcus wulumuqiensis]|uniref:MurNAc-LAA domain-containing protein n=1 Tax=Deinococcus wulumuqiensis TaxID=980427 RepID=A0ABQ2PZ53_9DEIO|nr:N-acetylmuramoyl-L-alanine amidase [Deinococcus wulumuqiensis]QII20302.1 N-acetylmuramoyl-L-alanine amidase [Deinococcus wulumuqiensis R12]GGP30797.1 hypothetical protein GCM10008021_24480 [Deinococcus wulumuqiensis]